MVLCQAHFSSPNISYAFKLKNSTSQKLAKSKSVIRYVEGFNCIVCFLTFQRRICIVFPVKTIRITFTFAHLFEELELWGEVSWGITLRLPPLKTSMILRKLPDFLGAPALRSAKGGITYTSLGVPYSLACLQFIVKKCSKCMFERMDA